MRGYLEKLPPGTRHLIHVASGITARKGIPAYLVGGFVRDMLLGAKNLDLDIVVEGDGIKFADDLAAVLGAKVTRHRRFGTATLILAHLHKIDIATARSEIYPKPASLPQVKPGTLKDDLFRRDFTINAMAFDIGREGSARLIDFFGGKDDLKKKKIRVLHALSFQDDPTRILRAIRFEQRYGFKIEPLSLRLLKEARAQGMLDKVQPQRTRDDLILILKEKCPVRSIRRMQELIGLGFISDGLKLSGKDYALFYSVEKQIAWFKKNYPLRRAPDAWVLYLMCLLDPLKVKEVINVCRRFAFRKGEEKRILSYKKITSGTLSMLSSKLTLPSKIFSILEPLSYEVILMLRAKYKKPGIKKNIPLFLKDYNGMRIHIGGDDLRRLGLAPGPHYQRILSRVLKARLDGKIGTKEEELELAVKLMQSK